MDPTNVARSVFKSPFFTHTVAAIGGAVAAFATSKAWTYFSKPGAVAAPAKVVTFDAAKFSALTPEQQTAAVTNAVAVQAAQVS